MAVFNSNIHFDMVWDLLATYKSGGANAVQLYREFLVVTVNPCNLVDDWRFFCSQDNSPDTERR